MGFILGKEEQEGTREQMKTEMEQRKRTKGDSGKNRDEFRFRK
jgi:hypothetical protein